MADRRPIVLANGTPQQLPSGDRLATGELLLGANVVTVSATAPSSPATGHIWYELSGSALRYGWPWTWNGVYWLAPQQHWAPDTFSTTVTNTDKYLLVDPAFNYYLNNWRIATYVATTNNGSNYWSIDLARRNAANTATSFNTQNTSANAINGWVRTSQINLSVHVDVALTSAIVFAIRLSKTVSPGEIYLASQLTYQLARI